MIQIQDKRTSATMKPYCFGKFLFPDVEQQCPSCKVMEECSFRRAEIENELCGMGKDGEG